jgi:hypothetical protein
MEQLFVYLQKGACKLTVAILLGGAVTGEDDGQEGKDEQTVTT